MFRNSFALSLQLHNFAKIKKFPFETSFQSRNYSSRTITIQFNNSELKSEGILPNGYYNFLIKEGEYCKQDQVVLEMETCKAISQVRSPHSGIITKIFKPENGENFEIGNNLFEMEISDSNNEN